MTCDMIKDMLLTDYIDGQIVPAQKEIIDAHLATCASCRALLADVVAVTAPLAQGKIVSPPARVWNNIEKAIADTPSIAWYQQLWDQMALFFTPKPAFVMATVMSVVLVVAVFLVNRTKQSAQIAEADIYIEEQVSFLAALDSQEIFINGEASESDVESGYALL